MKNRVCQLGLVACLMTPPALMWGQSPGTGKVGVINIQEAIASTSEGKKAFSDLQKKFQPRQQELQRLQQDIQAIQDQLQKQAATLSEEEQRRLSRELDDKQKVLKRSTEDANADFGSDRDEAIRRIGQKMVRIIGDYAQQNGYSLVVDDAQIPVYFAAKEIDITEEVVKRYDAANPLEAPATPAASTPTPPGASALRPAGTAPKPVVPVKPADKPKP